MLDPVAVILKFAFLAVLYLFLIWMARSALKDLSRAVGGRSGPGPGTASDYDQATGMHAAVSGLASAPAHAPPRLRVVSAPGLRSGDAYDLSEGATLGRGDEADIRLQDAFASSRHARLVPQGDVIVLEDLGSTNGTRFNGEVLAGPQPLHPGDVIQIGDSEFRFER